MYNAKAIIAGLVIFLALLSFPFWYTNALGNSDSLPSPEAPANEEHCVESKDYMRSWHMDLLNSWRDEVVRNGHRIYVSKTYGDRYPMSLSDMSVKSCIGCHQDRQAFCGKCHDYVGVQPYCFDCHIEGKE